MSGLELSPFVNAPISEDIRELDVEPRLAKRACNILSRWRKNPGFAFPEVFESDAELEGAYRFFSNPRIDFDTLLDAHVRKTLERVDSNVVLSLEDTTTFTFGGPAKRTGLGRINKNNQGFLGHFACLVSADGARRPFGVVAAELWTRPNTKKPRRTSAAARRDDDGRESLRWHRVAEKVEMVVSEGAEAESGDSKRVVIHVQDREGDIYFSLAMMCIQDRHFVIRCLQNRCIEKNERGDCYVFDALEGLPVLGTLPIHVHARPGSELPDQRKRYPPRKARDTTVSVTATTVEIRAPAHSPEDWPKSVTLNVVHVFEPCPPEGEEPVEWILLTTESIATFEDVKRVIDMYASRWLIEEFFKSIKTGCEYEKRQFESYHSLTNALAMCIPIAWEMLALRSLERTAPDTPANKVISAERLEVLHAMAKRNQMPEDPTVRDALICIAGMGGFLKRNGRPGWITLRRGFTRLLGREEAWRKARERCDQS